jgi:hypothetical protein
MHVRACPVQQELLYLDEMVPTVCLSPRMRAVIANDEVEMVRYRLHVHRAVTKQFIIVESNVSITKQPKRLWIREGLSAAELLRYNVRLVVVPLIVTLNTTTNRTAALYVQPTNGDGLRVSSARQHALQMAMDGEVWRGKEVNEAMRSGLNFAVLEV